MNYQCLIGCPKIANEGDERVPPVYQYHPGLFLADIGYPLVSMLILNCLLFLNSHNERTGFRRSKASITSAGMNNGRKVSRNLNNRLALIVMLVVGILAGLVWPYWPRDAHPPKFLTQVADPPVGPQDAKGQVAIWKMSYEKAVLACLFAATYGAERSVKIAEVEATLRSAERNGQAQTQDERRDYEAIRALLPDNKRERDASYALYFEGVSELAKANRKATDEAFASIQADVAQAGLTRLIKYIEPVRSQIESARKNPPTPEKYEGLISELEQAVKKR